MQGRIHWWEPKRAVPRLLSGIEAGVIGGIAMLALLVSGSLWRGDPWWMPSNLLGSTFYGARALSAGPDRATLAGGCAARFHDRLDRSRLRTGLRRNPAQTPAGSAGNTGRSDMAWAGGCLGMAKDKPSGSAVFRPARHAFLACPVRGVPGIHGASEASTADFPLPGKKRRGSRMG